MPPVLTCMLTDQYRLTRRCRLVLYRVLHEIYNEDPSEPRTQREQEEPHTSASAATNHSRGRHESACKKLPSARLPLQVVVNGTHLISTLGDGKHFVHSSGCR